MFLRSFYTRQKKNICKFRLNFRKSVQTFHAKVVCPTFWDRPLREAAFSLSAFSLTTAMQLLRFVMSNLLPRFRAEQNEYGEYFKSAEHHSQGQDYF